MSASSFHDHGSDDNWSEVGDLGCSPSLARRREVVAPVSTELEDGVEEEEPDSDDLEGGPGFSFEERVSPVPFLSDC